MRREYLQHLPEKKIFKVIVFLFFALVAGFYLWQGITSASKFYPGLPGYRVQPFDSTIMWAGTRALFLQGISPYSPAGDAIIQTQYFGRPLQPSDKEYHGDQQKFAYPLHVVLLFLPTIFTDLTTALIILLISFYFSFLAGVWLWFHSLGFPASAWSKLLLLTIFLALPEAYTGFQTRQPAIWVFFFVSACIYLARRGNPPSDITAGFLLAWSTIKPQNSILVILYIVLVVYVLGRGLWNSRWFLFGFIGTGIVLLGVTWWILPGWIFDFLDAARDYRNYAGNTGAESVFGMNTLAALTISAIAVLLWLGIIWYAHRLPSLPDRHELVLAYAMALQVLIFPTHLYNFIFLIPLILITLKWVWNNRNVRMTGVTFSIMILLFLTLYFAYLYWLGILSEGLGGTLGNLMSAIRRLLPGGIYYFTITSMLLGPLLFWAKARELVREQP